MYPWKLLFLCSNLVVNHAGGAGMTAMLNRFLACHMVAPFPCLGFSGTFGFSVWYRCELLESCVVLVEVIVYSEKKLTGVYVRFAFIIVNIVNNIRRQPFCVLFLLHLVQCLWKTHVHFTCKRWNKRNETISLSRRTGNFFSLPTQQP